MLRARRFVAAGIDSLLATGLAFLLVDTAGHFWAERAVVALRVGEPDSLWKGGLPLVLGLLGTLVYGWPFARWLVGMTEAAFGHSPGKWLAGITVRSVGVSTVAPDAPDAPDAADAAASEPTGAPPKDTAPAATPEPPEVLDHPVATTGPPRPDQLLVRAIVRNAAAGLFCLGLLAGHWLILALSLVLAGAQLVDGFRTTEERPGAPDRLAGTRLVRRR